MKQVAFKMSEGDLQKKVIDLAHLRGIIVAHFRPAKTQTGRWVTAVQGDGKGYPDLTLCGSRVMFRELKAEGEYPSPEQRAWIAALEAAGADIAVWRPRDWHSGRIRAELEAIRVRPGQRTEKASA